MRTSSNLGVAVAARPGPTLAMRGKASIEEGFVELRGDQVDQYEFEPSSDFLSAVTAMRSRRPEPVLRFVERFGLLFQEPEFDEDERPEWHKAGAAFFLGEPLEAYYELAGDLHELRRLYALSQQAHAGDRYSLKALRRALVEFLEVREDRDDSVVASLRPGAIEDLHPADLVSFVSLRIAETTTWRLIGTEARFLVGVDLARPGFALLPASLTLAGRVWLEFVAELVQNVELRACKECEELFAIRDPRMRYCGYVCRNRYNVRAHRKRTRAASD